MTDRPVLFSAPMIRAILAGEKSQTRRVIKPQPPDTHPHSGFTLFSTCAKDEGTFSWRSDKTALATIGHRARCPYGVSGDRLWLTMEAPSWAGKTPEQRFWERVIKTDSCWEWMGGTNRKRYGLLKFGQKTISTHRLSYALHKGEPSNSDHVLHSCDKPWCVNPEHLRVGSNAENCADKSVRGRTPRKCGEHNAQSKMSDSDARSVVGEYASGCKQVDIALRFGISQGQVSKIVSGSRRSLSGILVPSSPVGLRTLEVTGVRVERLQDISAADAVAEGVQRGEYQGQPMHWRNYTADSPVDYCRTPAESYRTLWESINGPESWGANPWVWVVEFRRVT